MKVVVKIIITVLIVAIVGFAVWYFFFSTPEDSATFKKMSQLIDNKENTDIDGILDEIADLEVVEGIETNKAKLLNDSTQPIEIEGGATYYSYKTMEEVLDLALNNYYVYTQVAKDVGKKPYRKIKSMVNAYNVSYEKLITKLEDMRDYHKDYLSEENESYKESMKMELKNKYANIGLYYKEALTKEAELVLQLKQFVSKYCFNDNFYTDTKVALLDLISIETISACTKETATEIGYFVNLKQSIDKYFAVVDGQDIFSGIPVSESGFLNNVEYLFKNYKEGLTKVFSYTNAQRVDVVNGSFVSELKVENYQPIKNVLIVLGY